MEDRNDLTTVNAGNDMYIYYCSPVDQGNATFNVGGWIGSFMDLGIHIIDGTEYYVYRSDQKGLGETTFQIY